MTCEEKIKELVDCLDNLTKYYTSENFKKAQKLVKKYRE